MPDDAVLLGPGEGRRFWTGLSQGAVKVESGSADFSVFESSPPPGVPGAPPHVHHSYDEAWFVIEGTVEFVLGDRRERLEAGGFAFAPRGVVHGFANPGPARARMLVIGSHPSVAMIEEVGRCPKLVPSARTPSWRFSAAMILPLPEPENPAAGVRSERAAADVGLIGLGQIGQVHAAAIRRSPVARLAAVADTEAGLLRPFAAEGCPPIRTPVS